MSVVHSHYKQNYADVVPNIGPYSYRNAAYLLNHLDIQGVHLTHILSLSKHYHYHLLVHRQILEHLFQALLIFHE